MRLLHSTIGDPFVCDNARKVLKESPCFILGPPRSRTTLLAHLAFLLRPPSPARVRRLSETGEDLDFHQIVEYHVRSAGDGLPLLPLHSVQIIEQIIAGDPKGAFKLPFLVTLMPLIVGVIRGNPAGYIIADAPPGWVAAQLVKHDREYSRLPAGMSLAYKHAVEWYEGLARAIPYLHGSVLMAPTREMISPGASTEVFKSMALVVANKVVEDKDAADACAEVWSLKKQYPQAAMSCSPEASECSGRGCRS